MFVSIWGSRLKGEFVANVSGEVPADLRENYRQRDEFFARFIGGGRERRGRGSPRRPPR
jgi:hypothetical protein